MKPKPQSLWLLLLFLAILLERSRAKPQPHRLKAAIRRRAKAIAPVGNTLSEPEHAKPKYSGARFKAETLKNVDFDFERKFNSILASAQQSSGQTLHDDDDFSAKVSSQDNLQQIEEETYRKIIESDSYTVPSIMNVDITRSLEMGGGSFNPTPATDPASQDAIEKTLLHNALGEENRDRSKEAEAIRSTVNDKESERRGAKENARDGSAEGNKDSSKEKKIPVFLGGTQPLSENQKSPTFMPIVKGKSTSKALNGKSFHELDYVKEKKIALNLTKTHNSTQARVPSGYYGSTRITY